MTVREVVFCDTSAIIDFICSEEKASPFKNNMLITGSLNLMELYYILLRDHGKAVAEYHLKEWACYAAPVSLETVKRAMEFRLANKKENMSYVDCIGYLFALEQKIPFLTSDRAFAGRPGVQIV